MKYFKTQNLYKASNVTFNPKTRQAYSYNWWKFVDCIGGLVVFNDYGYSNTTRRHQSKVRRLLGTLGIEIDLMIEAPDGLQNLDSAIRYYEHKILDLHEAAANPRANKTKNIERAALVTRYHNAILDIKKLQNFKEKLERARRAEVVNA